VRSRLRNETRRRGQSLAPRVTHRLKGFDFQSKPYQDFSLNLDDQLACLVQKWRPRREDDVFDCSSQQSTSELGL
jgi:hypothetical protein